MPVEALIAHKELLRHIIAHKKTNAEESAEEMFHMVGSKLVCKRAGLVLGHLAEHKMHAQSEVRLVCVSCMCVLCVSQPARTHPWMPCTQFSLNSSFWMPCTHFVSALSLIELLFRIRNHALLSGQIGLSVDDGSHYAS